MADDSQPVQQILDSSLPTAPRTEADPLAAADEKQRLIAQRSEMVDREKRRDELLNARVLTGDRLGDILDNEAAPIELKEQALREASQRESTMEAEKNANKLASYNEWAQAVQKANNVNKSISELGIGKKVEVPTPDKFGLTTADVVEAQQSSQDPGVQAENEKRQKQAALEAQQAAQEQARQAEQQAQMLGAQKAQEEQNRIDGFMAKQNKISQEMQSAYRRQMDAIDTEQNALSEIDPDRFWNSKSTFQKILGAISIGMGAVGGALTKTGGNAALDIINKAIDNDINAQKVNNEQKISLKQNAIKRAALEIDRLAQLSKDQERQQQMLAVSDQLKAQQAQIAEERANKMALSQRLYSTGITPEEADQFLDHKQTQRKIALPGGNFTLAGSEAAAKLYNTANKELENAKTITNSVIEQLGTYGKLDAANPWSDKKSTLDGSLETLVGALRIPITGPGVLTDNEYKRIMGKVLGDPASFFTVGSVAKAKMTGLQNTLKMIERANLESATGKKWLNNEDKLRIRLIQQGTEVDKIESMVNEAKKRNPDYYNK